MPRIVSGVPVHNGASDLERCFRSLLAQDCPDLEILVSDNASTDATPEILARFAASDRRIRIIRQKHNLDMSANFAAVNDAADCEFFAWRAHDDWSDPDWARILVGLLQNNPKANLAMSRTVFYHRDYSGTVTLEHAAPATPADDYARVKLAANNAGRMVLRFLPPCRACPGVQPHKGTLSQSLEPGFWRAAALRSIRQIDRHQRHRVSFAGKHPLDEIPAGALARRLVGFSPLLPRGPYRGPGKRAAARAETGLLPVAAEIRRPPHRKTAPHSAWLGEGTLGRNRRHAASTAAPRRELNSSGKHRDGIALRAHCADRYNAELA
jgi:hypothetical protein